MQIEEVEIDSLDFDKHNARKHGVRNLDTIKASLTEFGQQKPIVVDGDNVVIAGNGTLAAARALGWEKIYIHRTPLTGSKAVAYALADNRTAELATWDLDMLSTHVSTLTAEGMDLGQFGFGDNDFDFDFNGASGPGDQYEHKIEPPIYAITGEKPKLDELVNTEKCQGLAERIMNSNVSDDDKAFLMAAATRHNVFSFDKIAEYYAHASDEMQQLMEDSALVIIDFDKAIANGFVVMSEQIVENFTNDNA